MILCECCGKLYHTTCHQPNLLRIPEEPWYCTNCSTKIDMMDKTHIDITLDFAV